MDRSPRFWKGLAALALYCLPCIVAMAAVFWTYSTRALGVADEIRTVAREVADWQHPVNSAEWTTSHPELAKFLPENETAEDLIDFFARRREFGDLDETIANVDAVVESGVHRNMIIMSILTLLPFLLLGHRLAFGTKVRLSANRRLHYAREHWPMKGLVAGVICLGWNYVVAPYGRGASTIRDYLISVTSITGESLPVYIETGDLAHTVAGFLGWYLYLVTYFLAKLYHNDVASSRVYRFLFGKMLFTFGVALTFSVALGNQAQISMFLVGYFPLAAFDLLKKAGVKAVAGAADEEGSLIVLAGISRWQLLRLQEEGIGNVTTMAASRDDDLEALLPEVMRPMVPFWIDQSQLMSIVGQARYAQISDMCMTASEFLAKADDPAFIESANAANIKNPAEVSRLLTRTFEGRLIAASAPPAASPVRM